MSGPKPRTSRSFSLAAPFFRPHGVLFSSQSSFVWSTGFLSGTLFGPQDSLFHLLGVFFWGPFGFLLAHWASFFCQHVLFLFGPLGFLLLQSAHFLVNSALLLVHLVSIFDPLGLYFGSLGQYFRPLSYFGAFSPI